MPNNNYVRGRAKEYRIVYKERACGRIAQRTAGSHSPIDVISIDLDKRVIRLIQAKPKSMSEKQIKKLMLEHRAFNGLFRVEFEVR